MLTTTLCREAHFRAPRAAREGFLPPSTSALIFDGSQGDGGTKAPRSSLEEKRTGQNMSCSWAHTVPSLLSDPGYIPSPL